MVLVARYTDEVNNSYVIREDPFCVVDDFANVESMMSSNENSDSQIEVKLSGANLGRLILREIGKANLDTAACVGQGIGNGQWCCWSGCICERNS